MTTHRDSLVRTIFITVLMVAATPALAHEQTGVAGGFVSGFTHPIFGPDHLIAMVAVGLWGAQLGAPAIWVLPITFPLVMAVGGVLGVAGIPLPLVEIAIALSAVALGIVVALRWRAPLAIAAVIVGTFAIFHGHAHGMELPQAVNPLAYGVGFVLATGLLHLCGILIGLLVAYPMGERAVRVSGAAIAVLGGYFLVSHLGLIA